MAILEGTVSLPQRLQPSFAATINDYGTRWCSLLRERLEVFFPRAEPNEEILGYIWAHSVPCPVTGHPTPLAPDLWLSRGAGSDAALVLIPDGDSGSVRAEVVVGNAAAEYGPRRTYKNGTGTSVWTGETFGSDYINEHAQQGRLGFILLAVAFTGPLVAGRAFRGATDEDLNAVAAAEAELEVRRNGWELADLVPSEAIADGLKTAEPIRMGIRFWRDMLTSRQLLVACSALELLDGVLEEARGELSDDEWRAVNLYLAFALDKALNYNSRMASWHASRQRIRNTFDQHDFGFKWTFAEMDGARALFPWAVRQVAKPYREIAELCRAEESFGSEAKARASRIMLSSATDLPLESSSVDAVVTDPPYYDNVMYGELSDYFYVWLKRALRNAWPELTQLPLSNKESEAVANPALFRDVATHSGRRKRASGTVTAAELADRRYEELLTQSFKEALRVLKPDGVLTVMFTHKRVDAWDTLGSALLQAGFAIHASWPVHTESDKSLHQAKKNAASSTIFLTCRKRDSTESAYWADIRGSVELAAEHAAARFAEQGISGVDLTLATYGPVLSVLSRCWPVYTGELGEDGEPEVMRPDVALDLAREKVAALKKRGLLAGRDVDFDRTTDWYLLAWSDFQAEQFPYDEARKLSIALHLDVEDIARSEKIVRASGGTVTILTPAQRRTAGALDPDAASWPTQLDALQALMLVYEEEGLNAAKAWLERTGREDDPRFEALVGAALRAVPRIKSGGDFVRPEARTLESIRQTLFPQIEPPPDPGIPAEQLALDVA